MICRLLLSFLVVFYASSSNAAVPVFDFSQYEKRVQVANDTLYVVNFWATWCKPCIEELPYFEKISKTFSDKPVKIILVSQDTKSRLTQVSDFLAKHNYSMETFLLSAGNPNAWIDKVDPKWSGAIPITLFYRNGKKIYFRENEYPDYELLEKIIQSKLK